MGHTCRRYVVVGASAGLGFIAAKELAKHNAHVVLTARNDERGNECARSYMLRLHGTQSRCSSAACMTVLLLRSAMTNIRKEVGQGGSMDLMHVDVADFK